MSDYLAAGRLEDHPFAALVGRVYSQGASGELTLESGDRRRRVWFLSGHPVAVVSDDPRDHISRVLLDHGKVAAGDAERLAALPETREALGGADYIAKDALSWGVRFRFVNLCYDLFRWEEGDYAFREGTPPRDIFLLKIPAPTLVLKGVGYMARHALLEAVPDGATLGPAAHPPAEAPSLGPEEKAVLEECHPGRSVGDLLGAGWNDADQGRQFVYAFSCLGLVSLAPAGAAPPAAAGGGAS